MQKLETWIPWVFFPDLSGVKELHFMQRWDNVDNMWKSKLFPYQTSSFAVSVEMKSLFKLQFKFKRLGIPGAHLISSFPFQVFERELPGVFSWKMFNLLSVYHGRLGGSIAQACEARPQWGLNCFCRILSSRYFRLFEFVLIWKIEIVLSSPLREFGKIRWDDGYEKVLSEG